MPRKLLTIAEVSELLSIPTATLYRWRTMKYGPPALRVGKYLRYDPNALEEWLRQQESA